MSTDHRRRTRKPHTPDRLAQPMTAPALDSVPPTEPVAPPSAPKPKPQPKRARAPQPAAVEEHGDIPASAFATARPKKPQPQPQAQNETEAEAAVSTEPTGPDFISADDLAPPALRVERDQEHWYWCGVLPELAGFSGLDIAGVNFPIVIEEVTKDKRGRTHRIPCNGAVLKLTRAKVRLIAERLARTRLRPHKRYVGSAPMTVANPPEDAIGYRTIRIPPQNEREMIAKGLLPGVVDYIPHDTDRPAADFLYCVWLDEVSPSNRGLNARLPEPVSKTGIRLPPADARDVPASERMHITDHSRHRGVGR